MDELVKLKGVGDGVKINLADNADFSEITEHLRKKIDEFRRFFGSGHCNIYFTGRKLEKSDMLRLESVVSSMLPESNIHYGERRLVKEKAELEIMEEDETKAELLEIRDVVTTNFKSNRARLYEGTVRSGRSVESDGHLILMGNVERGAKLVAVGNIIVMGALLGCAEAGCMGNRGAYVAAVEFNPEAVNIAGVKLYDYEYESGIKKAVVEGEKISVYEYLINL